MEEAKYGFPAAQWMVAHSVEIARRHSTTQHSAPCRWKGSEYCDRRGQQQESEMRYVTKVGRDQKQPLRE